MKKACALIACCTLGFLPLQGQVLDEYIALGLANNQQFLREQLGTRLAAESAREAQGLFLPNMSFEANYTWADGGRTLDVPAGDLVNPAYDGLNQLLGEDRYPTNIANTREQFLPNNFHETKLRLIQPLLNTDIYFNHRAKLAQVTAQQAREEAYRNQLVREIKVAYYQYLSALEQDRILAETRVLLQELVRFNEKLVSNQVATREVLYGARAELSALEARQAEARRQTQLAQRFFNYLLNRELAAAIQVDSTLAVTTSAETDLNGLTQQALNGRQEIAQLEAGLEATQLATRLNRNYLMPEVNLVGDLGYQGFDYTFDENQDFWLIQVGASWPLFQGFQNRSRVAQSRIREAQLQSELSDVRQQIALEVSQAYFDYQAAQESLRARRSALASARENFRLTEKRYREQQALLVQYNEARTAYTTAQLNESLAKYNLQIKAAALEAATQLTPVK